jgi:hypothetical protein
MSAKNIELLIGAASLNDRYEPFLRDWKTLQGDRREHYLKKIEWELKM